MPLSKPNHPKAMRFPHLFCLLLATSTVCQHQAPADSPEPITQAQLRSVLSFLQSHDPDRRKSAYKACRERGEEFQETYVQLLMAAKDHHATGFKRVLERKLGRNLSEDALTPTWKTWEEKATTARQHIQTDHDKGRAELDAMDQLFADANRAWDRLRKAVPSANDHETWINDLEIHATALREIAHELNPDFSTPDNPVDLATIARELDFGITLRDYLATHANATSLLLSQQQANETNDSLDWPSRAQKTFATILNERRVIVGLKPLILDQPLSIAALGHSREMASLGYFAHESPVAENRTPALRARNAGSDRFAGECIYMGSASPADAEQAWWYSCGHRLINYNSDVSILGIAVHQLHWTLKVGR